MKLRYELVDSYHPDWRGQRFSSQERAIREWEQSTPQSRFFVKDRLTGETVRGNVGEV